MCGRAVQWYTPWHHQNSGTLVKTPAHGEVRLGDDILIYSTHLHSNRLFKSTSMLKYELSILFLFIMLRELPTQLIELLTIDDCHYLSYAETPVEGSAQILLFLMLCWKSENPCTYVASLPSALCPVLALSSLDPGFLLVWSWQQNAGTFPLMCHCVAHIGSLSSWHAASSHFEPFLNCLVIKLGKKRAKSGSRKTHWRYFDKL